MQITTPATVGFYGKLPIVGDFVSRRLPEAFITRWDTWLQSSIASSQNQLGDTWLDTYLTSHIWRFVLSPGVCGEQAVAGILMPSVDKVGRYFPLTVACFFDGSHSLSNLFSLASSWFEQLEEVALTGLEGQVDLIEFDELVATLPVISIENIIFPETHNDSVTAVIYQSLWSNGNSDNVDASLMMFQGLPPVEQFSEFLKHHDTLEDSESGFSVHEPNIYQDTAVEPDLMSLSDLFSSPVNNTVWQSWALTNTGLRRKHNEDSILNKPEVGLWVVADGMGGHEAGDVASQLIVNTLNKLKPRSEIKDYLTAVESSLQHVNTQLRELGKRDFDDHIVGSTVVALLTNYEHCAFIWAGDSRLYRFRNNQLTQLTQDHCLGNEASSESTVKSVNVITRAMGADDILQLDSEIQAVNRGDVYLLCSDGLDKELSHNEIEALMQKNHPKELAKILMDECLFRGGRDNISIIVITPDSNLLS